MKFFVKRVGNVLVADGDDSADAMRELPAGKVLSAEVKQPRNVQFHRLFFALCKRIGDGVGADAEQIATVFKLATGHYDVVVSKTHGQIHVPKSISFAKMENADFSVFFEKCVRCAFEEWGIEPAAVNDLIGPKTEKTR